MKKIISLSFITFLSLNCIPQDPVRVIPTEEPPNPMYERLSEDYLIKMDQFNKAYQAGYHVFFKASIFSGELDDLIQNQQDAIDYIQVNDLMGQCQALNSIQKQLHGEVQQNDCYKIEVKLAEVKRVKAEHEQAKRDEANKPKPNKRTIVAPKDFLVQNADGGFLYDVAEEERKKEELLAKTQEKKEETSENSDTKGNQNLALLINGKNVNLTNYSFEARIEYEFTYCEYQYVENWGTKKHNANAMDINDWNFYIGLFHKNSSSHSIDNILTIDLDREIYLREWLSNFIRSDEDKIGKPKKGETIMQIYRPHEDIEYNKIITDLREVTKDVAYKYERSRHNYKVYKTQFTYFLQKANDRNLYDQVTNTADSIWTAFNPKAIKYRGTNKYFDWEDHKTRYIDQGWPKNLELRDILLYPRRNTFMDVYCYLFENNSEDSRERMKKETIELQKIIQNGGLDQIDNFTSFFINNQKFYEQEDLCFRLAEYLLWTIYMDQLYNKH